MQIDKTDIEASAFIFDLLSVSFAYPTEAMYQSLLDGQYIAELGERIMLMPQSQRFETIMKQLAECQTNLHTRDYEDFEAEYISLFEHNKDPVALHLNGHLYSDDEPQPVPVYQRLLAVYSDFDLEMTSDRYTEQPDHLSIQLEFFAYLFRLLLQDNDERTVQKIETAISEFCIELEWVNNWATQLSSRPAHAFYHPLAQLLLLMLEARCGKVVKSEK